jgi:hypothetical protein
MAEKKEEKTKAVELQERIDAIREEAEAEGLGDAAVDGQGKHRSEAMIFEVPVMRNSWGCMRIRVEADSEEDAKRKAVEQAADEVFDEDGSDYWADVPEKVED